MNTDTDELDADVDGIAVGQTLSTELEVEFLPLFPDGPDESLASEWAELFTGGES